MIDVIIVPQGAEYQAVKKGLNNLKIPQPLVISIPIGVNQIDKTLTKQKFWQSQPKRVLMMGLCGSLSTQHSVGDAVLYQNCYGQNSQNNIVTNQELNQLINQKLNLEELHLNISWVSGITSDRVIATITQKQQLARKFTANVVDMESFAYLNLLQQNKIAVSILRIVSDDVKYNLPNLEQTISESGNIKPVTMAREMLKQPIASIRFIKSSLQGLKKLQEVTIQLFRS
ncbi:Phosphorylase [Hyella patelloides LEGE 07179]|uniref:Phosphorylase n=1 Tax=Hyella patelloides LEGE 07179 TaxID=945734 RepID=A0A563W411_9CYAN|nr:phosphorylase [Hyella patelloides]VEP18439.1 Phosphorylase [Hyella patelloides LEGE 07179]